MEELSRLSYPPADGPGGGWSVVLAQRPLVAAVCRKYLKSADVEDATQETFVRYFRKGVGQPIESLPAWLSRVARSVCLDMLRRKGADRRRVEGSAALVGVPHPADALTGRRREAITRLLPLAMRQMSAGEQHLIAERFIADVPLRVIAGRTGQSVATVSRATARAVAKLAGVLGDLGVGGSDEHVLAEYFADHDYAASRHAGESDVLLRSTRDRRRLEHRLRQTFGEDGFAVKLPTPITGPLWPGWTRPIRVGVTVLHRTIVTYGFRGTTASGDVQAMSAALLADPRFDLVAVVEPRTSGFGPVERTIRDYRLTDGLIEADDAAGLATLDVLLFGTTFIVTPAILQAIRTAVGEDAVGYLKDGWLDANHASALPEYASELLLARPPIYGFHMPGRCGAPGTAVVRGQSPWITKPVGQQVRVHGCGPAFRPLPGVTVLMEQTRVVPEHVHGHAGLGPLPMPYYLTGHIGRGRAVVVPGMNHAIVNRSCFTTDYLPTLTAWLAEPRRERELGWDA